MKYAGNQFPAVCACGRVHTADDWQQLPLVGIMPGVCEGRRFYWDCEMRNCACESTLAVKLKGTEPINGDGIQRS